MITVVSIISRMNVGGPALLLSKMADTLPNDFNHILLTGQCEENEIDFLTTNAMDSRVIYVNTLRKSIFFLDEIRSLVSVIGILRKLNPDIVHTHLSKAGVIGRIAAKIAVPKAKIVHTFHGHLLYGYFPNWKIRIFIFVEKVLAKFSDHLVAVSNPVQLDLQRAGVGNSASWSVIHPGVAPIHLRARGLDLGQRSQFDILWVGRFTKIKNPILAIEAFQAAQRSTEKKIALTMVGDGELLPLAKDFALERNLDVNFVGWVKNPLRQFSDSDALLLTSKNEGLPLVILESAACKVPAISTNVGGVGDFVVDEEIGLLVKESAESIAKAICKLAEDSELREKLGENAFEKFSADFTDERYVEKHITLYQSLVKAP